MGQSKIFCFLLLLSSPQLVTSCNTGEYRANEICCTMCPSGTHVLRHCTLITSTTCGPCVPGSYMDRPNGMEECLSCKSCDADAGFKSIEECTYTMDTVCDCKEGYYCTQKGDKGCQNCRKQIQRNAYESTDDKGFNKLIQPGSKASHAVLKENIIKAIGETHSQKTSTGVHPPSKKKLASQLEGTTALKKEEFDLGLTEKKHMFGSSQDAIRKSLMQIGFSDFSREALKSQEAGKKATVELRSVMQSSMANMHDAIQSGMAGIRDAIQSTMTGIRGVMQTGITDIQVSMENGMASIQESIKSELANIKVMEKAFNNIGKSLENLHISVQSGLGEMSSEVDLLVSQLSKYLSSQALSPIQFKDIASTFQERTDSS